MKTNKIKLVVEDYVNYDIDELMKQIKALLPDGVLLVKSSVTEIEC